MRMRVAGDKWFGLATWDETDDVLIIGEWSNLTAKRPIRITSNTTTLDCGRDGALVSGELIFGQGFYLGASRFNARKFTNASSIPTGTIDRAKGEIVFNFGADSGEPWGWYCTVGHATAPTFTTLRGLGTQQSTITDADTSHASADPADLDVLATKINALIAVVDHFGFTATS